MLRSRHGVRGDELRPSRVCGYGSQDVGVVLGQLWNGKDMIPPEATGGRPLDTPPASNTSSVNETSQFGSQADDTCTSERRSGKDCSGANASTK